MLRYMYCFFVFSELTWKLYKIFKVINVSSVANGLKKDFNGNYDII